MCACHGLEQGAYRETLPVQRDVTANPNGCRVQHSMLAQQCRYRYSYRYYLYKKCVGTRAINSPSHCRWNPLLCPPFHAPSRWRASTPPLAPRCTLSFTVCSVRTLQPLTTNPLPPLAQQRVISMPCRPVEAGYSLLQGRRLGTILVTAGPNGSAVCDGGREAARMLLLQVLLPWVLATGPSPRCTRGWMVCCSVHGRQSGMVLRSFRRASTVLATLQRLSTAFPQRWAVAWRVCVESNRASGEVPVGSRERVSCRASFRHDWEPPEVRPFSPSLSPTSAAVLIRTCLPRRTSSLRDPAGASLQP
jgi:hypothetical protein